MTTTTDDNRSSILVELVKDDALRNRMFVHDAIKGWSVEHQVAFFGMEWRTVCEALGVTRQELDRWVDKDIFPQPDGEVDSYYFSSMNYGRPCVADAWLPETVAATKSMIEQWRADHKAKVKERQKKQARIRRQVRKNAEDPEKHEVAA